MKNLLFLIPFVGIILASSCSSNNNEILDLEDFNDTLSYALGILAAEGAGEPYFSSIDSERLIQACQDNFADNTEVTFEEASTQLSVYMGQKQSNPEAEPEDLPGLSYAMGVMISSQLKDPSFKEMKTEVIVCALREKLELDAPRLSYEDATQIFGAYMEGIEAMEAEANQAEGEAFLAANAEKDGVIVTDSGLQFEVVEQGDGPKPASAGAKVRVHYTGTLIDGTKFDSSVDRGQPAEFYLNQVIPGWTEGLQLMNTGSKYRFYIPSDIAYGANPRPGGPIGPNATLIFDVELIEIIE